MKKKLTPDKFPYFAATCQAVLYVHACVTYLGTGWGLAIGLPLGIVVSFSIAYGSSQINDVAARRRRLSWVGLILLMTISPIVVAPALYTVMEPSVMAGSIGLRIALCTFIAIAPDGAILLSGAIAGRGMFGIAPKEEIKIAAKVTKPARKLPRNHIDKVELVTYLQGNPGASKSAVARHFGVTRQAVAGRMKSVTPQELGLTK
jgi:hypothetical protein